MSPNPQETADLVTFTEEILNGKLYFFAQSFLASVDPMGDTAHIRNNIRKLEKKSE